MPANSTCGPVQPTGIGGAGNVPIGHITPLSSVVPVSVLVSSLSVPVSTVLAVVESVIGPVVSLVEGRVGSTVVLDAELELLSSPSVLPFTSGSEKHPVSTTAKADQRREQASIRRC